MQGGGLFSWLSPIVVQVVHTSKRSPASCTHDRLVDRTRIEDTLQK
jgi:hypothetical protein